MIAQTPRLLTVRQAAEALQLSKVTLYKLMKSGQLASFKVGGSRRLSENELLRFIEEREKAG